MEKGDIVISTKDFYKKLDRSPSSRQLKCYKGQKMSIIGHNEKKTIYLIEPENPMMAAFGEDAAFSITKYSLRNNFIKLKN